MDSGERAVEDRAPAVDRGRYTAQVSVVDQLGRRFAFSRAQVVLLP